MRLEIKGLGKRPMCGAMLACLVAVAVCACSSQANSTGDESNKSPRASSASSGTRVPQAGGATPPGAGSAGALDFTLVNFTRFNLYAVYLSPHDSAGWEENVLGSGPLYDGNTVRIRFNPEEKAVRWDLRVEDEYGNNAEWKNLNLREISKITLRTGGEVVIAEAE